VDSVGLGLRVRCRGGDDGLRSSRDEFLDWQSRDDGGWRRWGRSRGGRVNWLRIVRRGRRFRDILVDCCCSEFRGSSTPRIANIVTVNGFFLQETEHVVKNIITVGLTS
jgi:hypothetical protein